MSALYNANWPKVLLRPFRSEDFAMLASIRRDEALQHLVMAYPSSEPISDECIQDWINRRSTDPNGCFFVIADVSDTESFGFAQISGIHHKGRYGYCGLALAPNARGRGIGLAALSALCDHAKAIGLIKIMGEARADNAASLRFCEAVGFASVGLLQQHYFGASAVMLEKIL